MLTALTVLGIALAVTHTVVNGFHDAPNALALPVRFRALTPRVGLVFTALVNVAGVWAADAESRGLPGKAFMKAYMEGLRAAGEKPARDWDKGM